MQKTKLFRIQIRVHPMVYRWIENNFEELDGGYDLTKSPLYFAVTGMLQQSNVKCPSMVSKKLDIFKSVNIYISEYDFYHYGFQVSELQMCRFSKFVQMYIIDQACHRVMMAKVFGGIQRSTAIRSVLDENLMDDSELSYECLRKTYFRKYIEKERALLNRISESTDIEIKKINVKTVPSYFNIK